MGAYEEFNRGVTASLDGDDQEALLAFDAALRLAPRHVGALAGRALSLHGLGRLEEALEAFGAASLEDPGNPVLDAKAGLCCLELGLLDQGRDAFRRAMNKAPDRDFRQHTVVEVYNLGGWFMTRAAEHRDRSEREQEQLGYQLARVCFEIAHEHAPDFEPATRALGILEPLLA